MKYEYVHSFTSEDRTERDDDPTYRIGRPTEGLIPVEFLDVERVLRLMSEEEKKAGISVYNEMFYNLSEATLGKTSDNKYSLHPLLVLACNALIQYTQETRERNAIVDEYLDESARQQQLYYLDHDEPYCDYEQYKESL